MKQLVLAGLIFSIILNSTVALAEKSFERRSKQHDRIERHESKRQHTRAHQSKRHQHAHHHNSHRHQYKRHARRHHIKRRHRHRYYSHNPYYEFIIGATVLHSLTEPRFIIVERDRDEVEVEWGSDENAISREQGEITGCYIIYTGVDGEEIRKELSLTECEKK